ncbi:uncharacterized protein UV8b_03862 [Ustilaginoidea virens]|uniref:Uncharacterized protein n=1 Tax=Ustilaginoidea virens TaxID=1159556 RepID=A0A063BLR2_USTVR|nr:uncharacterized protein UV8b_03862 [Ustilaginoidea virens]QUC19621.1 hypothetical protein UV8b_03862 [Ustilaginoidea virens]GAO13902.1 hypothetical protein UVI_02003820 [Ustilaginoidea virens]
MAARNTRPFPVVSTLTGFALLLLVQLAAANTQLDHRHGQDADAVAQGANGSTPMHESYPPTYFALPDGRGLIYGHVASMVVAWVFILPVAVMLSIARSGLTLGTQLAFIAVNSFGVLLAAVYNTGTPDLYPNNSHHKIGWIATFVVLLQVIIRLTGRLTGAATGQGESNSNTNSMEMRNRVLDCVPAPVPSHRPLTPPGSYAQRDPRFSNDSGQGTELGTELGTESLQSDCISELHDEQAPLNDRTKDIDEESVYNGKTADGATFVSWRPGLLQSLKLANAVSHWMIACLGIFYRVVDRVILPFGFVALTTGIVTFARLFEGQAVFSGLAHWIKGGVFFWLGLFTLGRWSGSFAELGWAWNLRPVLLSNRRWHPSAEFVESALIFFYGSTNVFLEHLGGWGGEWNAQDLEHMSIAVLFIGGGLCGMLVESSRVRTFLNNTASSVAPHEPSPAERMDLWQAPETESVSLNPIPALIIMLLGTLMSSHHQSTAISTMVHKQWGNLLLGASLSRGLTYVLVFLRPPRSILPSRPPTELLASFCLMSGGIIFMASSADTIKGMIHYKLDPMFMYTMTMGLVAMLMAWEITVLAIKGRAARKMSLFHSRHYMQGVHFAD